MTRTMLTLAFTFTVGVIVGHVQFIMAQTGKNASMTRQYTGPDNLSHIAELEAKFTASGFKTEVSKMLQVTGAEIHREASGAGHDWRPVPHRQYIVTLSGQGEMEVAGGTKVSLGPGHIHLVEDTTGKGHRTKVTSTEDWVFLALPLADRSQAGARDTPNATYIDHDKVAAVLAKGGSLVKSDNLTVSGSFRTNGEEPEIHDKTTHVWYVLDGSGTFVTGGTLIGGKVTQPGLTKGTNINGGETHELTKGDVIVVPPGTPHWWKQVPKSITLYAVNTQ